MGCDIHVLAEVRKGTEWGPVTEPVFKGWGDEPTNNPYDGRNYDLFAILANVRNGHGFAGIESGTGWKPIATPRGVPKDASGEYLKRVEQYGADGHSHSWATLAELDAYDWSGEGTTQYGVFTEGEYVRMLRTGEKVSYSRGVSGGSVVILTPDDYEAMLAQWPGQPGSRDRSAHYYIQTEWHETAAEAADGFYTGTLPALRGLGAPDAVRLVYFFDN